MGVTLSSFLLYASFPPLGWSQAAWFALVPLIVTLSYLPCELGIKVGFCSGLMFWLLSVHWLVHVSYVGWVVLSLYCALYFIPFCAFLCIWFNAYGILSLGRNICCLLISPLLWAGLEFMRARLFTGFSWNALGVSQYENILLIQHASWGSVYPISALVICVNLSIAFTVFRYLHRPNAQLALPHVEFMVGILLLMTTWYTGWRLFQGQDPPHDELRVALIQPNIAQPDKWSEAKVESIYHQLSTLTQSAIKATGVDLIVWPETALPDDVRHSDRSSKFVYELATNGVPLLVGSMDTIWKEEKPLHYLNSSFLFNEKGTISFAYDKRHLVMFGEYVPLESWFPFMTAMTPIQSSFTSGSTSTVFRLASPPVAFSVLICFEDTVSSLARESVNNGAQLLINQTNDAWFDVSAASRQHLAQSVFRAVENRVPLVRVANTGLSCSIRTTGQVYDLLSDENGNTLISGFRLSSVRVYNNQERSFYTRHGDLVGKGCAAIGLGALAMVFLLVRKRERFSS